MAYINLNATTPPPPTDATNVHWRTEAGHAGTATDPIPTSAHVTGVDVRALAGSGGGTWGSITGTLADQTDLVAALAAKADPATRSDVTKTTISLAANATETGTVALGKLFTLKKVTSTYPARVELYSTAAARGADAGRAIGTDPTRGSANGIIVDLALGVTDADTGYAAPLAFVLSPAVTDGNSDDPDSANVYYRITNLDSVARVISATFSRTALEV